ncbi:MAG: hypothetical protein ACYS30_01585 [Planctomycetota bacterium]
MNARGFLTSCVLLVANIQNGYLLMAGARLESGLYPCPLPKNCRGM